MKKNKTIQEMFDTKTFEFTPKSDYGDGKAENTDEITSRKLTDVLAQMTKQKPDGFTGMGGYGGSAFLNEKENLGETAQ